MSQFDETGAIGAAGIARRTVMKTAGLGLGIGLVSGLAGHGAEAQQSAAEIWSGEYWAAKGDVKL